MSTAISRLARRSGDFGAAGPCWWSAAWGVAATWAESRRQQGVQPQRQQGVQPQKAGNERQEYRRERMDRGDHMERRERFSREERDKLRQDLLDAIRDMKGRR